MGTGLLTALDSAISNDITQLGDTNGFVVQYSSTTAVAITSGNIEANGKNYTLAADTTHTMTSLAAAFDLHYIYIDDSASTQPTAVIIDSITEPSFSDSKRGWYNGDDRCIGVIVSPVSGSTIATFVTQILSDKAIRYSVASNAFATLASSFNPDGTWQTPTVESSTVIAVNANEILLEVRNSDAGSTPNIYATSSEFAAIETGLSESHWHMASGTFALIKLWLPLGASRNIKIAGADDDDNGLTCECAGFGILR